MQGKSVFAGEGCVCRGRVCLHIGLGFSAGYFIGIIIACMRTISLCLPVKQYYKTSCVLCLCVCVYIYMCVCVCVCSQKVIKMCVYANVFKL